MATITINVKDEVANNFRENVMLHKGTGKGKLGEAISEAMVQWIEEIKQRDIANAMIQKMEKGFKMGKINLKSRDGIYDR